MGKTRTKLGLVGNLIRQRREELGLSQRVLGQRFNPQVTTQFISNIERGVTSLPLGHVGTIGLALQISEAELLAALEQEYAAKITDQIGMGNSTNGLEAAQKEVNLVRSLVSAFHHADSSTREAFLEVCDTVLGLKFDRSLLEATVGDTVSEIPATS